MISSLPNLPGITRQVWLLNEVYVGSEECHTLSGWVEIDHHSPMGGAGIWWYTPIEAPHVQIPTSNIGAYRETPSDVL